MTVIAIVASRGAELMRVAQLLALYYGSIEGDAAYIELLRPDEHSLFCSLTDLPATRLRRAPVECLNPLQASNAILEKVQTLNDVQTVIIDFNRFAPSLSDDLLEVVDLIILPTLPALPSLYDTLRTIEDIQFRKSFWALKDFKAAPWVLGTGCVGGGAVAARLRGAAQRLKQRLPDLETYPQSIPILDWGLPLVHWSEMDCLLGWNALSSKATPSPSQLNLAYTLYLQTKLLAQHPDRAPTLAEMRKDPQFYEPWRFDDRRGPAQRHADLSEDLHLVAAGLAPLPEDLQQTAQLDDWELGTRKHEVLQGTVSDHPSLMTGDHITTSALILLDSDQKWARTLSRFYSLSRPLVVPHEGEMGRKGLIGPYRS